MITTREQAYDEIKNFINVVWPNNVPLKFQNKVRDDTPPDDVKVWGRVTVAHTAGNQTSLGSKNNRRFIQSGSITINIFTPSHTGLVRGTDYAKPLSDHFGGGKTPLGMRFFRATFNEIGPSGSWFQTNVTVDFEYSEKR